MNIRRKIQGESAAFLLIAALIIVLLNLVALRVFTRWDLTARSVYSLSDVSRRLMGKLEDRLTVKAYFTSDLPGDLAATPRYVRDLLEEYRAYSGGNLRFEFIDPKQDSRKQDEAQRLGISKVRLQAIARDQLTFREVYAGIAFSYRGQSKAIPFVRGTSGLEYEFTSQILQLTGQKRSVGFLTGHDEPQLTKGLQGLQQRLNDQYNTRAVELRAGQDEVPSDLAALLVIGPQKQIPARELFRIDQYLMNGGAVGFFAGGVKVDLQSQSPTLSGEILDTGVNELLDRYGIHVNSDLVFEPRQSGRIPIRGPMGIPLLLSYPPWPTLAPLAAEHPVTFRLEQLTLPFTSSLRIEDRLRSSRQARLTVLGRSTPQSWRETSGWSLEPNRQQWARGSDGGPFPLAATLEGTLPSAWADRPAPGEPAPPDTGPMSTPDGGVPGAPEVVRQSTRSSRLLVVGGSDVATDVIQSLMSRMARSETPSETALMINAVDWLTQERGLIAVRAKEIEEPLLRGMSDTKRTALKVGNILGWPLAFAAFGLVRWKIRARAQRNGANGKSGGAGAPPSKPAASSNP